MWGGMGATVMVDSVTADSVMAGVGQRPGTAARTRGLGFAAGSGNSAASARPPLWPARIKAGLAPANKTGQHFYNIAGRHRVA